MKQRSSPLRIFFAEALGMLVFVYCWNAAIAQVLLGRAGALSLGGDSKPITHGDVTIVALAWALGLALGYSVCAAVSGGHLNPAVTVVLCLVGRIDFKQVPAYWAGQAVGALTGAGFVLSVHGNRLSGPLLTEDKARLAYASFPLLPAAEYNGATLFWEQLWNSSVFMFVYLSLHDDRRRLAEKDPAIIPIVLGVTYAVLILATGINAVSAINPARDLFPRLVAYIAGYKSAFMSYFWIPWLVPFAGSILGGLLYSFGIGWFWPDRQEAAQNREEELALDLQDAIDDLRSQILPKSKPDDESTTGEEDMTLDLSALTSKARRGVF